MIICELGFPPDVIDEMPQQLIEKMLVYKGVKNVTMYGGDYK